MCVTRSITGGGTAIRCRDYRFVYCDEAGLEGFLVLQAARLGEAADIGLVDWEARNPKYSRRWSRGWSKPGGYDSLSIWSATLPDHVRASLQRSGFVPVDKTRGDPNYRPGLLAIGPGGSDIRNAGPEEAGIFESLGRWDLRMAYSDFY